MVERHQHVPIAYKEIKGRLGVAHKLKEQDYTVLENRSVLRELVAMGKN